MKMIIFGTVVAVALGCAIGFFTTRSKPNPDTSQRRMSQKADPDQASADTGKADISSQQTSSSSEANVASLSQSPSTARPHAAGRSSLATAATSGTQRPIGFTTAIERLLSPQSTHAQREEAWQQLRDSGQLNAAITELEKRTADSPQASEPMAALGQAYLYKAGTLRDIREQGILGMQADKTFDAALQLDPSNWDARFMKAVAMSHWPPQLGKGQEVIDHFTQLINQQETQTPQPHFSQSYAWLGDQYEKQGRNDYARAAWERGAALFPNDESLRKRLSKPLANADGNDSTISAGVR